MDNNRPVRIPNLNSSPYNQNPIIKKQSFPSPPISASKEIIDFCKSLQKYEKKQSCGMGGCGQKYQIPVSVIDSYANATIKEDTDDKEGK